MGDTDLNMSALRLHEVYSVHATEKPDVFVVRCRITDAKEETDDVEYVSQPNDLFGLNPVIRQWLVEHDNEYSIVPYVPPTIEEQRAQMPLLTSRQFWMAAASINLSKDDIVATVKAGMEDDLNRKVLLAEITEASTFERLNPSVLTVTALVDIPDNQLDTLWTWAAGL